MDRLSPPECPETLHSLVSLIIHAGACPKECCACFGVAVRTWLDRWRNLSWKRVTEQKATFTFTQGARHGQKKRHSMDACVTLNFLRNTNCSPSRSWQSCFLRRLPPLRQPGKVCRRSACRSTQAERWGGEQLGDTTYGLSCRHSEQL